MALDSPWSFPRGVSELLADACLWLQVELYLRQLAELELLLSEVRAGGGTSQELEGRMLVAEEMLRTILRETLSLQGTTCSLPWDGAIWAVSGRVCCLGLFAQQRVFLQPFSFLLTSL